MEELEIIKQKALLEIENCIFRLTNLNKKLDNSNSKITPW